MTLHELMSHDRTFIEEHSRRFAKGFMMGDKLCTRMLGGPIMFVDPSNYDFAPWLGLEGFWESWITLALGRAIQPGNICYDVGSAWGYYSMLMAWGGASKVVAIEPIPDRAEYIKLNMRVNYLHTPFAYVPLAMSDGDAKEVGVTVLPGMVCGKPNEGRHVFAADSFDNICKANTAGKVDMMKVDIDGGELLFWEGVQETIASNPNLIMVMEVNSNRYHAEEFYSKINKVYPVMRVITTDGKTRPVTVQELVTLASVQDEMLWLQQ